jgi:hypothetical protein
LRRSVWTIQRDLRLSDAELDELRLALERDLGLDERVRRLVPELRDAAVRAYLAGEREDSILVDRSARALEQVFGPVDHPASDRDAPRLPLLLRPPVLRLVRFGPGAAVELVDLVDQVEGGEP